LIPAQKRLFDLVGKFLPPQFLLPLISASLVPFMDQATAGGGSLVGETGTVSLSHTLINQP
jgi:hypothetical protein